MTKKNLKTLRSVGPLGLPRKALDKMSYFGRTDCCNLSPFFSRQKQEANCREYCQYFSFSSGWEAAAASPAASTLLQECYHKFSSFSICNPVQSLGKPKPNSPKISQKCYNWWYMWEKLQFETVRCTFDAIWKLINFQSCFQDYSLPF